MSSDTSRVRVDTPNALAAGTRLGEYELLSLLGVGGFGIVYLAFDHALEREVAIKEYMPASLAGRTETMHVTLRSHSDAESFALGLKSFVNEAKLLARFDHPSLLKVHRFWEANGTAYMAMPVMRGRTVKEIRQDMGGAPDEAWMRRILMPLLGAVERLHSEGVYHRDIAPDNIQIEPDGSPVLLDFGAARRVLSDKSQALTAILKPAYAPIEQYGEAGAVRQGPWTDLYALGATLHYLLLGRPPSPATARAVHDDASSLTTDLLPGCSDTFLQTIDWMLCPRPTDRPQNVAELRDVLEGRARPPMRRPLESAPVHWERTSVLPPGSQGDDGVDLDVGDQATQFVARPATPPIAPVPATEHVWIEPELATAVTGVHPWPAPAADAPEMTATRGVAGAAGVGAAAGPRRRSWGLPLAAAALAVMAVVAGTVWWQQPDAAPAMALPAPVLQPIPPAASAPAAPGSVPAAAQSAAVSSGASAPAAAEAAEAALPSVVMPTATPVKAVEVQARPAPERAQPQHRPAADAKPLKPRLEPVLAAPAVVAPAPEPAAAATPAPSCGPRAGVRYHVCMERECGRGEFAGHPACLAWKQEAR